MMSAQSHTDFLQIVRQWYPELQYKAYFLPPLYFNRESFRVQDVPGTQILVPIDVPTSSSAIAAKSVKLVKMKPQPSYSVWTSPGRKLKSTATDNDIRDDEALTRILHGLRTLADSHSEEVMMVISGLDFGKYLHKPEYADVLESFPRLNSLPKEYRQSHYHKGDFDILIVHKQYGMMTFEIKSVGAKFLELNRKGEEQVADVARKLKEAIVQLNKAQVVLQHLVSDRQDIAITKILAMPNIYSSQIVRAVSKDNDLTQDLCKCLGVQSVDSAIKMSLMSEQFPDAETIDYNWWQEVTRTSRNQELMRPEEYELLVARFCGPATTVKIHCVTTPRLELHMLGEAVREVGNRMARLILFPDQVKILHQSPPRLFLTGPPGTGKTVVLILQGLKWLQLGHEVHVVSMYNESQAVSVVIKHQLTETSKALKACPNVLSHTYNFLNERQLGTAARELKSRESLLFVLVDEAGPDRDHFGRFCSQLIRDVPGVCLWAASTRHDVRPSSLDEFQLRIPLRSPPVVIKEVMDAGDIQDKAVYEYDISNAHLSTAGPAIVRIKHSVGQSEHTGQWPQACAKCGHEIASKLTELKVGNDTSSLLSFRDVLILCDVEPIDQENSSAQGLVQGLRACLVPVCVVKSGDEDAIRDMALCGSEYVNVTHWKNVRGLERKIIVIVNYGNSHFYKLYTHSRSLSQLIIID